MENQRRLSVDLWCPNCFHFWKGIAVLEKNKIGRVFFCWDKECKDCGDDDALIQEEYLQKLAKIKVEMEKE